MPADVPPHTCMYTHSSIHHSGSEVPDIHHTTYCCHILVHKKVSRLDYPFKSTEGNESSLSPGFHNRIICCQEGGGIFTLCAVIKARGEGSCYGIRLFLKKRTLVNWWMKFWGGRGRNSGRPLSTRPCSLWLLLTQHYGNFQTVVDCTIGRLRPKANSVCFLRLLCSSPVWVFTPATAETCWRYCPDAPTLQQQTWHLQLIRTAANFI